MKPNTARHVMNSRQVMSFDIPTVAEIQLAAERGQRITQDDVSAISQAESALTGRGPSRGGPAATAQSLSMRQMNFENKVAEVSRKPSSAISLEDAEEIQATEVRESPLKVQQCQIKSLTRGTCIQPTPGVGYISAQVRSIADSNDALGLTAAADVPAYITKDDARDAQHAEATVYGGQNPRGGMAAQMQSAADKIDNARRGSYGSF
ncbi:Seed maturation protein [Penicillium samsonianum]|uniref:Seed maturation protein n=1 Tax=Penicillium samsonianum TaxID=1882272 RepID=UPI002546D31D|nr:Seed maturation protein [Penicillium samsonianum]KAJ6127755.1 Seed maturation protein [Penicillium samsonianum]